MIKTIDKETVKDVIDKKYNIVHNKLYNVALEKYSKEVESSSLEELYEKYKIVEKQNSVFYKPSIVYLISKKPPFNIKKINFEKTDYWPVYQYTEKDYNINDLIYTLEENYTDYEVIYIDYVRNYVVLFNKYFGKLYTIPLDKLPANIKRAESFTLKNSFKELYNNISYGR